MSLTDDLCQCQRCGRMHKSLGFGLPPEGPHPQPGDTLVWKDPRGLASEHRWRVLGVHLGAEGQESLIEAESLTHKPGWTGEWESHPLVFIPEVLARSLSVEKAKA